MNKWLSEIWVENEILHKLFSMTRIIFYIEFEKFCVHYILALSTPIMTIATKKQQINIWN